MVSRRGIQDTRANLGIRHNDNSLQGGVSTLQFLQIRVSKSLRINGRKSQGDCNVGAANEGYPRVRFPVRGDGVGVQNVETMQKGVEDVEATLGLREHSQKLYRRMEDHTLEENRRGEHGHRVQEVRQGDTRLVGMVMAVFKRNQN